MRNYAIKKNERRPDKRRPYLDQERKSGKKIKTLVVSLLLSRGTQRHWGEEKKVTKQKPTLINLVKSARIDARKKWRSISIFPGKET